MTFLPSREENQWAIKISALSAKFFWSYCDRQQEQNINLYSAYMGKITGSCLIYHTFNCNGLQSWDLYHSIHHEMGNSERYSVWLKCTLAIK